MNNFPFFTLLEEQLTSRGFLSLTEIPNAEGGMVFYTAENPVLYIFGVFEQEALPFCEEQFRHFVLQCASRLSTFRCQHLIGVMTVLTEEDEAPLKTPSPEDERIHLVRWNYSLEKNKLTPSQGDPNQVFRLESALEKAANGEKPAPPIVAAIGEGEKPWACISIFVLWVAVLLFMLFYSDKNSLIAAYGLSRSGIFAGQFYRFFTSMFLHDGFMHLLSNAIFLIYFGVRAERLWGRKKFLFLYLLSGLMGGIFSVAFHNVLAIGASGAIYGLLGAMVLLTKKRGSAYTDMNYATILLLAFVSISGGFLNIGIDNFAHIGGFLGGLLCFTLFQKRQNPKMT